MYPLQKPGTRSNPKPPTHEAGSFEGATCWGWLRKRGEMRRKKEGTKMMEQKRRNKYVLKKRGEKKRKEKKGQK